jgi:hypothetical protein
VKQENKKVKAVCGWCEDAIDPNDWRNARGLITYCSELCAARAVVFEHYDSHDACIYSESDSCRHRATGAR